MKKSMLACALVLAYSATNAAGQLEVVTTTPAVNTETPSTGSTATPSSTTAPTATTTAATTTAPTAPVVLEPTPQNMSCQFHFPANTTIPDNVLKMWVEKAAVQTFDYSSDNLDIKLQQLKACFTDAGWIGFTTAIDQSGNLISIRKQKLAVSAQVDGAISINPIKENHWRLTLPMQVVYQNKQDKVTQLLTMEIVVARKMSGDLGIDQIIASPRQAEVIKH